MDWDLSKPPLSGVEMKVPGPHTMGRMAGRGFKSALSARRRAAMGNGDGQTYYWIIGKINGVVSRDGPHTDEIEARLFAKSRFDAGSYRIIPLHTRNPGKARQYLAHVRLDGNESDPLAIQHRPDTLVSTGL